MEILLEWHDTKFDTVTATRLLTNMSCSGVVAFFGPEGRCHTEAIIAQSRNLPMISYVSNLNYDQKPTRQIVSMIFLSNFDRFYKRLAKLVLILIY